MTLFDNLRQHRQELEQTLCARSKSLSARQLLVGNLNEPFDIVERQYDVAVDLYVDSLSIQNSRGSASTTTLNFHGAVGVVQTGPQAVASVVQNLSADTRQALIDTLEEAKTAIPSAEQLTIAQREEIAEMITEAVAELQSDTPNNTKIRSLLGTVGDAFKMTSGAFEIYDRLKGLLIPLGIQLP
jgi:hypothetical protein